MTTPEKEAKFGRARELSALGIETARQSVKRARYNKKKPISSVAHVLLLSLPRPPLQIAPYADPPFLPLLVVVPVTLPTLALVTLKVKVNCCCCRLVLGKEGAMEVTEAERELAVRRPVVLAEEGEREERVREVGVELGGGGGEAALAREARERGRAAPPRDLVLLLPVVVVEARPLPGTMALLLLLLIAAIFFLVVAPAVLFPPPPTPAAETFSLSTLLLSFNSFSLLLLSTLSRSAFLSFSTSSTKACTSPLIHTSNTSFHSDEGFGNS